MAADWVPAVTAGITAVAALGGQAIAGRFQGRNQERMEARQRRDRAAEVLAEVQTFLVDASPDRLGINANEERSREEFRGLGERRERIRIPLLTLAGSHSSRKVRDLAGQLEVELADTLHMTSWFVADLLRDRDSQTAHDQAKYHHTAAPRLLDQLLDVIHEPETGRPVGAGCSGAAGTCQTARAAGELTARRVIVTASLAPWRVRRCQGAVRPSWPLQRPASATMPRREVRGVGAGAEHDRVVQRVRSLRPRTGQHRRPGAVPGLRVDRPDVRGDLDRYGCGV